jgi:hypothetical protein
MSGTPENRKFSTGTTFTIGLVAGAVCYLLAESLILPNRVDSPIHHGILLANRLGFIYPPVVGLWLGWLQRSWRRVVGAAVVGVAIGFAYRRMCASGDLLAGMAGFPSLLGGIFGACVGSNRSDWLRGLPSRLGKGLLAGMALGFVYMVALNGLGFLIEGLPKPAVDMRRFTDHYIHMVWRTGPVALGLASGLFFILIPWAVGLKRVRFEDVETAQTNDRPSPPQKP